VRIDIGAVVAAVSTTVAMPMPLAATGAMPGFVVVAALVAEPFAVVRAGLG
jgi:hypothetical protein